MTTELRQRWTSAVRDPDTHCQNEGLNEAVSQHSAASDEHESQPTQLLQVQRRRDITKCDNKKENGLGFIPPSGDSRNDESSAEVAAAARCAPGTSSHLSYHVAKWMILRTTAVVYFVAFLVAYQQNIGLMGKNGLQPAIEFWEPIYQRYNGDNFQSKIEGFRLYPTLNWWVPLSDHSMRYFALTGITVSLIIIFLQEESMILMILLWLLDFSLVTVAEGTSFYQYGWESQLLETGFLGIFLCHDILPSFSCLFHFGSRNSRFKRCNSNSSSIEDCNCHVATTRFSYYGTSAILYLYQWLCFRISMGAGLIKIRGDSCWTEKTCLMYHFETQPIPSPTSFMFHFLPEWMLRHAINLDLFVQVYTSWFVLFSPQLMQQVVGLLRGPNENSKGRIVKTLTYWIPLSLLRLGGLIQVGFMVNIILSGNFAFLNHLTMIPALACLDDACWPRFLREYVTGVTTSARSLCNAPIDSDRTDKTTDAKLKEWRPSIFKYLWARVHLLLNLALFVAIANLSWPVIANLLQLGGRQQQMNASFGRFRLVNTYGAFGSVGQARYEPILSISYTQHPTSPSDWLELEFPCKPGAITRRPCFCAPYHYRITWNAWFVGFKPHYRMLQGREAWMLSLVARLLDANKSRREERPWLDLLDYTSSTKLDQLYHHKYQTPLYAKIDMYHYQMAAPLWNILPKYLVSGFGGQEEVVWWNRTFDEELIPPVALDTNRQRLVPIDL